MRAPRGLAAWALLAAFAARAQETPPTVITEQHGGTFVAPPAQVDPVYLPQGPNAPARPDAHATLQLRLAFDLPLRKGGTASLGRGTQGSTAASPTLQAHLRFTPLRDPAWFAQLVFFRYLQADRQQPWHPDFSYAFGYDDGRAGHWSLLYANYTGTRWHPGAGEGRFNFLQGQWSLARHFALPAAWAPALLVGDGDAAVCTAGGNLTPRYVDFTSGATRDLKTALALGCRYTRPQGWFAELTLFAYPQGSQQQPWDPDFTYGFGYEPPGPGRLSIRYANYSGNRFPGRARGAGEGTPRSGSVTLGYAVEW